MADLYEVLLVDGGQRWHAGFVVDDEAETDLLLRDGREVPLFASRPALEHFAQEHGLDLEDELPDEIDLDLGGWLVSGSPEPRLDEVLSLWQLLIDDPDAGAPLHSELAEEAYDDLVEETGDWFAVHGGRARAALASAVQRLRASVRQA